MQENSYGHLSGILRCERNPKNTGIVHLEQLIHKTQV